MRGEIPAKFMTSAELIYRVQNYKFFRQSRELFNADEIYTPANDAQKEILTDLRVLEGNCNLALASLQEEYSFSAVAITGVSNATPIVITSATHSLHTGDSVIINGVLGNTAANGSYTVTKLTATTFELDDSVGNGAYTSGGYVYHQMMQAFETYQVRKTGTNYGRLDKKLFVEIDDAREDYGASSAVAQINRYYESFGTTYTFGVQGIPSADGVILNLRFYRIPLSFQEISSTVDPLLGSMYDRCLYLGTSKYVIENLEASKEQISAYNEVIQLFESEKNRLRSILAEQRRPRPQGTRNFRL